MHFLKSSFCESKRFVTSPDCFTSEENRWRAFQVGLVLEVRGVRLSDRLATFNDLRGFVAAICENCVRSTCACGSFWSGMTCMSSPSTATRCPCLGSAVSGLYEPRLLLHPPCRAARRLLPAGSCARRWTWWRERGAA